MGDKRDDESILDKAKEKLEQVADKVRGRDNDEPGPGGGPGDAPRSAEEEARLRAAAATGGTPDVPVGTEEDVHRAAGTDPADPKP
jgi:hypothetical protein